jgi:hypothetical protein
MEIPILEQHHVFILRMGMMEDVIYQEVEPVHPDDSYGTLAPAFGGGKKELRW